MVGIDFVGPLQTTARGNCMILTITDLFSKWTEAYALPDKRASSVASALVNLFCNKGILQVVLSDNGSKFCNEENYRLLCEDLLHWNVQVKEHFIKTFSVGF